MKNFSISTFVWLSIFLVFFIWSAIKPCDYFIWFLEVLPAIVFVIVLSLTYKNFKLTPLCYWLILIHCLILMIGGHYTYARVPLFSWLQQIFNLSRNHYDRLGHFAQGFIPAVIAREILLRKTPLSTGKWLFTIIICFCLAISSLYELFEWWVAIATGTRAEEFLSTQGDIWDTQKDMLFALLGATASLLSLNKIHDRQLNILLKKNAKKN